MAAARIQNQVEAALASSADQQHLEYRVNELTEKIKASTGEPALVKTRHSELVARVEVALALALALALVC